MPLCASKFRDGRPCTHKAKRDGCCLVHWRTPVADCPVCYEPLEAKLFELPCKHEFHRKCLKTWFERDKRSCPVCRADVGEETIAELGVKIPTLKRIVGRLENSLFATTHDDDPMPNRFLRLRLTISDSIVNEIGLRRTILDFIRVRMPGEKAQIKLLREEIKKITVWENDLRLNIVDANDANAEKLESMYRRLESLVRWESVN